MTIGSTIDIAEALIDMPISNGIREADVACVFPVEYLVHEFANGRCMHCGIGREQQQYEVETCKKRSTKYEK